MRDFDYARKYQDTVSTDMLACIASIYECLGYIRGIPQEEAFLLDDLVKVAKIQSIKSSNVIEGIITTENRMRGLAKGMLEPKNRNEQEIAGYREALKLVHEKYRNIRLTSGSVLQIHKIMMGGDLGTGGGCFKTCDNFIVEIHEDGARFERFRPVSALQAPQCLEAICQSLTKVHGKTGYEPLILTSMFVLDFLCIHPFADGNGRMSRLLTLLLTYRSGIDVGKYISLEAIIEKTKEAYYAMLQASSLGWHEGVNDYNPFVKYMLGVVLEACAQLTSRLSIMLDPDLDKTGKIMAAIRTVEEPFIKRQLLELCPGISEATMAKILCDLLKNGEIKAVSKGRNAAYMRNAEQV